MSKTLQIAMLLAVLLYFILLIRMLKKKTLNLKYTLLWLFSGVLMLLLATFPGFLDWFSKLVGIYEPTNALFAIIFFCVIIILMSLTAIVSKLNEKNKRLIQSVALLEKRVRELEERT
ncbi:DUF2304 domain-containing protein [Oscillibacter sp.]|uniref:DUF2304 domain-containing protein n=1 Tax=Oscillibacter sp. TaxID=1945593 RepID=UPI00261FCF13|nr:DUF2304 domain-containing protein [Oscillibacter sp.]MDD3346473.1 DUF2304 domain-containing protein [Oscillibacter sp.]